MKLYPVERPAVINEARDNMIELTLEQPAPSRPPAIPRPWTFEWLTARILSAHNIFMRSISLSEPVAVSASRELTEIRELASTLSDIDEHLELMFAESLLLRPRLIVELGVRGGTSTFVFLRAAKLCGASIVSVDAEDCSSSCSDDRWSFVHGDDVKFAEIFPEFSRQRNLAPSIDLLFIDTSHYYAHTVEEIAAWFPWLSPRAKVMFHDTNMGLTGRRRDGCFQLSWENQRGVVRAIEEYLGITINETQDCIECAPGWMVRHKANCNGFTILDRMDRY